MPTITNVDLSQIAAQELLPDEIDEEESAQRELVWNAAEQAVGESRAQVLLEVFNGYSSWAEIAEREGRNRSTPKRRFDMKEAPAIRHEFVAAMLTDGLLNDGGCTIDPATGKRIVTGTGFVVSLRAHEIKFSHAVSEQFLRVQARSFVAEKSDLFDGGTEKLLIGGWVNPESGDRCLALSRLIEEQMSALALARQEQQRCIWDLRNQCEVPVALPGRIAA